MIPLTQLTPKLNQLQIGPRCVHPNKFEKNWSKIVAVGVVTNIHTNKKTNEAKVTYLSKEFRQVINEIAHRATLGEMKGLN